MPEGGWSLEYIIEVAAEPTVACPEEAARAYFDTRTAVGWMKGKDGAGKPCARTLEALKSDLRTWHQRTWPNIQADSKPSTFKSRIPGKIDAENKTEAKA